MSQCIAACRGTSQAEQVRNNLAASCKEMSCARGIEPSSPRTDRAAAAPAPSSRAGKGSIELHSSPSLSVWSYVSHICPGVNIIPEGTQGTTVCHSVTLLSPCSSKHVETRLMGSYLSFQVEHISCYLPKALAMTDLNPGIFPLPVLAGQRV